MIVYREECELPCDWQDEWTVNLDTCSDFLQFVEERVPYYLFVDSLKPIELLVCFSALVRWGESGGKRVPRVESSGCLEHRWAREHIMIKLRIEVKRLSYAGRPCHCLSCSCISHTGRSADSCSLMLSFSHFLAHLFGTLSLTFLFISTGHHPHFLWYLIRQRPEVILSFRPC